MSGVVASVNGRNGIVTIVESDVTNALGFTHIIQLILTTISMPLARRCKALSAIQGR